MGARASNRRDRVEPSMTDDACRIQTTFTRAQVESIERIATREGWSRSELVRRWVENCIAEDESGGAR